MKTELIWIGKTTSKHVEALITDYVQRINHYVPFHICPIPELRHTKNLSVSQQKQEEGLLIMKQIVPSDYVVLLDEHGQEMRSLDFAQWLQKRLSSGRRLVFVIGGPYGFAPSVYHRADEKVSLSQMTYSHQLVRVIMAEQLYRACTIIRGEPYHHE